MKYIALIPLVFVASCASRPQLVVRPAPPAAVEPVETVRYGEIVRAYHVARFIDPTIPKRCTNSICLSHRNFGAMELAPRPTQPQPTS